MRLINVDTLDLEEFYGDQIPKYAILSHTWGRGEVTFQNWRDRDAVSQMPGFAKIRGACRQARKDSLSYLWVDTNCIDKTSSAELSEAINSMFAWYRDAQACYAFLVDVPALPGSDPEFMKAFRNSRWFTRGWTLQELIAPREVVFFDQKWKKIGRKSASLRREIAAITGIDAAFLTGHSLIRASVAQKMSWLSRRVTTRVEDMAYCVLGIFDINMPLLYGEGMKAFIRLQEEIIKVSTDHTIFCWTWIDSVPKDWVSMLAPLPAAFEFSGDCLENLRDKKLSTYSMTNAGLSIRFPIVQTWSYSFAILDVNRGHIPRTTVRVAIPISPHQIGTFRRLPFPPAPPLLEPSLALLTKNLIVSARPGPLQGQLEPRMPLSKYSILLTFGNALPLLDQRLSSYAHLESEEGHILIKDCSDIIGIETYPADAFDHQRGLVVFPLDHEKVAQASTILVRLGRLPKVGCVLAFTIRILASGKSLWFCEILSADRWQEDELLGRQKLLRHMEAQVSEQTKSKRYSSLVELNLGLGIHNDLRVFTDVVVRPAHLSLMGEVSVVGRTSSLFRLD
ncbi:hypothetical protein ACHAPT_011221 [Fusarium lateritium]